MTLLVTLYSHSPFLSFHPSDDVLKLSILVIVIIYLFIAYLGDLVSYSRASPQP